MREENLVEEDSLHLVASERDVFDVEIQHQVVASHKMSEMVIQRVGTLCGT